MGEEEQKRKGPPEHRNAPAGAPRVPVHRRLKKKSAADGSSPAAPAEQKQQANNPRPASAASADSVAQKRKVSEPAAPESSAAQQPAARRVEPMPKPRNPRARVLPPHVIATEVQEGAAQKEAETPAEASVSDVVSGKPSREASQSSQKHEPSDALPSLPDAADESTGKREPAVSQPEEKSSGQSRFGRWRANREQQREAEIARENERVREHNRREQIRRDPALDGLRAEDKVEPERAPLSRMRKLAYTALALVLVVALYIGVVFFSPLLAVEKITVRGASLMDSAQVEQKLSSLRGVPLSRVSEDRVRELVGSDGALRGVQMEIRPPHELVVTVKERVPIAAVKRGEKYALVDNEGQTLREVDSAQQAGVPIVQVEDENLSQSAAFRIISNVLVTLPTSLLAEVSEVKADSTSSITLILKDKVTVLWGTSQENEVKAKVLTKLLEATRSEDSQSSGAQGQGKKISVYDVSSPLLPVTR
mgnify:CR=1 FL=1